MYQYYDFCEMRNVKLFNALRSLFNIQKHTSFWFQSLIQYETHFPDYYFILSSPSFISVHRIKCQQYVVCEWEDECEWESVDYLRKERMFKGYYQWICERREKKVCLIMKKEEKYIILFKVRKSCFFLCEILSLHHILEKYSLFLMRCIIFTVRKGKQ